MIIEGKILNVMESWPLQLVVEVHNEKFHVMLQPDTKIVRRGYEANPKLLVPGINVLIEGNITNGNKFAMTAKSIKMLD